MSHKEEGSATGRRYKHRRPEYLWGGTEAIEALASYNPLNRKKLSRL
ncbi:MAG: hypothetical protein JWN85_3968 [Gammaproteobacteria bacterium]|nr:hypothetical protein [Gammaproteobacteria bacterium]